MPAEQSHIPSYSITVSVKEHIGPISGSKTATIESAHDICRFDQAVAAADALLQVLLAADMKAGRGIKHEEG